MYCVIYYKKLKYQLNIHILILLNFNKIHEVLLC